MPRSPRPRALSPGCPELTRAGGRFEKHQRETERQRGKESFVLAWQ